MGQTLTGRKNIASNKTSNESHRSGGKNRICRKVRNLKSILKQTVYHKGNHHFKNQYRSQAFHLEKQA